MTAALFVVVLAPAASAAAPSTLHPGSNSAAVWQLNLRLRELGYLPASTRWYTPSRDYSLATFHAVVAFQKQERLARDGIAGPKTLARIASAHRPKPLTSDRERHLEISISRQLVYLVAGGVVRRAIPVSTAAYPHVTPAGRFRVYAKYRVSWSRPYQVWLPWASYFNGGIALHEYADVPVYPASHGCVRVPQPFAQELYAWAPVGTPVIVLA